jgi:hypothetical protein
VRREKKRQREREEEGGLLLLQQGYLLPAEASVFIFQYTQPKTIFHYRERRIIIILKKWVG